MEKLLEPWTRKVITGAIQINKRLIENGLTWADVEKWLEENPSLSQAEINRPRSEPIPKPIIKECPNTLDDGSKCGKNMNYSIVKEGSEKYNEGFRTYWLCGAACCPGRGCGYNEWSKEEIK